MNSNLDARHIPTFQPEMASGVAVSEDVIKAFQDLKIISKGTRKDKRECNFICLKIQNDTEIVVELRARKCDNYETLMEHFRQVQEDKECRYALVDIEVNTRLGIKTNKLGLIAWCSDDATVKQRMLYTASVAALKSKLNGRYQYIQTNDESELHIDAIKNKLAQL